MKTAAVIVVGVLIAIILFYALMLVSSFLRDWLLKRTAAKWAEAERNARWESRMTLANGPFMEVYVEKVAYIPGKTKALESILHAEVDTREPDFGLELAVAKASAADLVFQLNQEA